MRNRNFLKLLDFTPKEIKYMLDLAADLKKAKYAGTEQPRLKGKNIALIFEKTSTRTRCAFEVAAYDQGAHVTYLGPSGSQIGVKESMADTARVLGRMFDGIEYRGFAQDIVEELARYAGAYETRRRAFLESEIGKRLPVLKEQLMVYFVFTYFCGAVYNGNPYGKMKMAATATLLIEELAQALWTDQGGRLTFLDFADGAHRFSREVEHSDSNKAVLEEALVRRPGFALRRLLAAVESDGSGE